MGQDVELVDNYKYLGVHTQAVYRKGTNRLYFLKE